MNSKVKITKFKLRYFFAFGLSALLLAIFFFSTTGGCITVRIEELDKRAARHHLTLVTEGGTGSQRTYAKYFLSVLNDKNHVIDRKDLTNSIQELNKKTDDELIEIYRKELLNGVILTGLVTLSESKSSEKQMMLLEFVSELISNVKVSDELSQKIQLYLGRLTPNKIADSKVRELLEALIKKR